MVKKANNKIQTYFFLGLFLLVSVLLAMIFKPFFTVFIVAGVLATTTYPLYKRLVKFTKGRRRLSAVTMVALILALIVAPLSFIGKQVFDETATVYRNIQQTDTQLIALPPEIESQINTFFPNFNLNVESYFQAGADWLLRNLGNIFSGAVEVVIGFILIIITMYFLFKDGAEFKKWLVNLSPLDDAYDETIFRQLRTMINSVVVGALAVALIQGTLVGLGFFFVGIPNVTLWGTVAAFAALLPGLGTALVTVPGIIYLFFTDQFIAAIVLAVWSGVLVGLVDNFLVPYFYSRGNRIHPLMILLSVFGGLAFFGPVGFLVGPIVLSVFLTLVKIYQMMLQDKKIKQ